MTKHVHPESLLCIPLVAQMLTDSRVPLKARAIDDAWRTHEAIPISVSGFNPLARCVFYPVRSPVAKWLKAPWASSRALNRGDDLLRSVLFAVHDYLHVWSYLAISELAPEIGFGRAPISADNFESFVFCHLLSETAATVGLDYWYLSTVEINKVCPIGSAVTGLTVSYREQHLPEYQRFNPLFQVQDRKFFGLLHRFYCDGTFRGFDSADLRKSPLLWRWLEHELRYAENQRRYCRMWFSYLAYGHCKWPRSKLIAPVRGERRHWRLAEELGELLWSKVKLGRDEQVGRPAAFSWTAPRTADPDFRFLNAARFDIDRLVRLERQGFVPEEQSFKHWLCQFMSRFEYATFDPELIEAIELIGPRRSFALSRAVFGGQKQISRSGAELHREPRDLMTLN
jgi:hypothetical protein